LPKHHQTPAAAAAAAQRSGNRASPMRETDPTHCAAAAAALWHADSLANTPRQSVAY